LFDNVTMPCAAKNLKLRSAEERVSCYLVVMWERDDRASIFRMPIDKHLIASQLGITRETFSRARLEMAKFGMRVAAEALHIQDAAAARTRFALDPLIRRRADCAAPGEKALTVLGDRKQEA